jgi:hypothetical protein
MMPSVMSRRDMTLPAGLEDILAPLARDCFAAVLISKVPSKQ